MPLITDNASLTAFCQNLENAPFITVDTEFMRERSFWPKLCLIQAASPDESAVIDPLATDMDLAPFWALLHNPAIVKVFHAARQDMEIIWKMTGKLPYPLFDTQIAAMVLGHGEQVGYEALVGKMLGRRLDKGSRMTDWSRRPLTRRQITYAEADVTHLRDIYLKQLLELKSRGRSDWVRDETDRLCNPDLYEPVPRLAWKRLKIRTNKPQTLAILREITAWRENMAMRRNIPRGRVIRDESLIEIAFHPPANIDDLGCLRGFDPGSLRTDDRQALLNAVKVGLATPREQCPEIPQSAERHEDRGHLVEFLKLLLKLRADSHDVAPRFIANSNELNSLANGHHDGLNVLQGWRRRIFGDDALELLAGRAVLGLRDGEVCLIQTD